MQLICLLIKSQYIFSIGTMNPSRRIFPSYKMNIILKLHMGNLHIAEIGKKQKIMDDRLRLTLNILCDVVRSLYHVSIRRDTTQRVLQFTFTVQGTPPRYIMHLGELELFVYVYQVFIQQVFGKQIFLYTQKKGRQSLQNVTNLFHIPVFSRPSGIRDISFSKMAEPL